MPSADPVNMELHPEAAHATGADVAHTNGIHKRPHSRSITWPKPNGRARGSSSSDQNDSDDTFDLSPELTGSFATYDPELHGAANQVPHFEVHDTEATGPRSRAYARIRSWADDPKTAQFPRIGKPVELMRHSYDCVVIGSGYGGSVAAARMARAGESVCLLERGQERWPGEYPSSTTDSLEQVHYSGEFAPGWLPSKIVNGGNPTGMFHLIFGNGQNTVVCNGE